VVAHFADTVRDHESKIDYLAETQGEQAKLIDELTVRLDESKPSYALIWKRIDAMADGFEAQGLELSHCQMFIQRVAEAVSVETNRRESRKDVGSHH